MLWHFCGIFIHPVMRNTVSCVTVDVIPQVLIFASSAIGSTIWNISKERRRLQIQLVQPSVKEEVVFLQAAGKLALLAVESRRIFQLQ